MLIYAHINVHFDFDERLQRRADFFRAANTRVRLKYVQFVVAQKVESR